MNLLVDAAAARAAGEYDRFRHLLEQARALTPPRATPLSGTPLEAARSSADVLRFEVPASHRPIIGRLITAAKKIALRSASPLLGAALRRQREFNVELVRSLERLTEAAREETLPPLSVQAEIETLRRLAPGAALLRGQRVWNERAADLAQIAATRSPSVTEANELIASLAALGDPLGAIPAPAAPLRPLANEVLRRQRTFNAEVMLTFANLLQGRPPVVPPSSADYRKWYEAREHERVDRVREDLKLLQNRPEISVVVSGRNSSPERIARTRRSLSAQLYDSWRLCGAVNDASGEWVAFIEPGDVLVPHAFAEIALHLDRDADLDWLYSDEDRLGEDGRERHSPFMKPDFSPELLRSLNYVGGLLVVRTSIARELADSEGYDLALRLSERSPRVAHLPEVLCSRSEPASPRLDDRRGAVALTAHLTRLGEGGEVTSLGNGEYRVKYPVHGEPLVSIIVPFKDKPELLDRLIRSLLQRTRYQRYELLLVSNNSTHPATFELLAKLDDPRIHKLEWNHPFNYPAVNNWAAARAEGELLLFLNNDMEVEDPLWLDEMVGQVQRPGVAMVGPKLRFPDGSIQHAGVVVGIGGYAAHPFWRVPDGRHPTAFGHADWNRNYLAVTSACVIITRKLFLELGGYDERFRLNGSDVDLGLRAHERGLQIVYTAGTWLYHHESASRRNVDIPEDDLWHSVVRYRQWLEHGDPFYNPRLTLSATDCSLKEDALTAVDLAAQELLARHPLSAGHHA